MSAFRYTAVHCTAFLIALLIAVLAAFLLRPAMAPQWVWAQAGSAAESTAVADYVLAGDLTLTDADGLAVGTLSVAGNLRPPAPRSPGSGELTLPGPDGQAWLALPGAEVRYDDEYGSGSGFFNPQQEAPAGLHYAVVSLTLVNRTRQPLAGRSQTSFFGSNSEPWLFGIDSAGGLAAPTGNPPGLPCEDLNPGAVGSCELAFLLPADRALAGIQILWPTSFLLDLPE